ncbi:hypothetical protein [Rhodococcoides fascians]|uniref:hypothetical protein n=1 Tax=Rhodococcoides fascians TaxID=1828 RepID=UPI0012D2C024|nr:hypothetical protein [Rhodococcus fascians]
MIRNETRAQIPNPTPEVPPGVKELVGNLDPVWWFLLIGAIVAAALGAAAKSQDLSIGQTRLSAAALGTVAVLMGGLSIFLLIWGV